MRPCQRAAAQPELLSGKSARPSALCSAAFSLDVPTRAFLSPTGEIGAVVAALEAGADYVGTIRALRQDAWWRSAASRFLNRVREKTTRIRMSVRAAS